MEERQGMTGSTLKIIAMLTMLIDHIGASLLENGVMRKIAGGSVASADIAALHSYNTWRMVDIVFRAIGRLAFPIFCFLLVEGFLHTRDWRKYFARLFLFSFISEIPFDLAFHRTWFYREGQNVFFTLWIGILVLVGMKYIEEREDLVKSVQYILEILVVTAGYFLAEFLKTDYSGFGIVVIAMLYFLRKDRKSQTICGAILFLWEFSAPLAFVPIYKYNGKRGLDLKYVFYFFYPVHLLLFGLIIKFCF